LGLLLLGRQDLAAVGINGLLLIVLPVLVTETCAVLVERAQPRNPFVYIFCSGFFAAALSALLCLLAGLGVLWFDGRFAMPEWLEDFVGYLWLIIFPRGLHQRHGHQRPGGVLPGMAGDIQPHALPLGALERRQFADLTQIKSRPAWRAHALRNFS